MSVNRKSPEQSLLETGTLVLFRVVDVHRELSPDKENIFARTWIEMANIIRKLWAILLGSNNPYYQPRGTLCPPSKNSVLP